MRFTTQNKEIETMTETAKMTAVCSVCRKSVDVDSTGFVWSVAGHKCYDCHYGSSAADQIRHLEMLQLEAGQAAMERELEMDQQNAEVQAEFNEWLSSVGPLELLDEEDGLIEVIPAEELELEREIDDVMCDDEFDEEDWDDEERYVGEDMDGDFDSGMGSAGHGTDEDYGDYGQYDEYDCYDEH